MSIKSLPTFELYTAKQAAIHFDKIKLKRQKVVTKKLEIIDALCSKNSLSPFLNTCTGTYMLSALSLQKPMNDCQV